MWVPKCTGWGGILTRHPTFFRGIFGKKCRIFHTWTKGPPFVICKNSKKCQFSGIFLRDYVKKMSGKNAPLYTQLSEEFNLERESIRRWFHRQRKKLGIVQEMNQLREISRKLTYFELKGNILVLTDFLSATSKVIST